MKRFWPIKMVMQPDDSGMCGNACVAMIAGVDLTTATAACRCTTARQVGIHTEDLVRGLHRCGVVTGKLVRGAYRREPFRMPPFALCNLHDTKTKWSHAVVLHGGIVYDPGIGYPLPLWVYDNVVVEMAYSNKKGKNFAYWAEVIPILGKKK